MNKNPPKFCSIWNRLFCGTLQFFTLCALQFLSIASPHCSAESGPKKSVDFNRQVRPLLAKHCYACHGPDKAESGVRLSDFESAIREADSGEVAVKPHKPENSEMIIRITSTDAGLRMPPEGEGLDEKSIAILRQWIAEGAEYTKHWSFQPIRRPKVPAADRTDWIQNPIDAFILSSLEEANLAPNPKASPRTLIRRLFYSLLGVPPTQIEIESFESNPSSEAYEELVDRLLADPRLGERWGRHWLDVVRYAETNSFERDGLKENAWKYRDYVIRSFNDDKPYDQFLMEQLAGDEIDNPTLDSLIATGLYRLGIWDDEPADPLQAAYDGFDDLVTVAGQGLLGLTLNCARCHDHKIDPIPQKDYYRLVAFFRDVGQFGTRSDQNGPNQIDVSPPELQDRFRKLDRELKETKAAINRLEQIGIVRMKGVDQRKTETDKRKEVLKKQLREFLDLDEWESYEALNDKEKDIAGKLRALPKRDFILGLARCDSQPPETHILLRGSPQNEGDRVEPGFVSIMESPAPQIPQASRDAPSAGRRKVFAEWVVDEKNWFTSRVIVNRLWQHHFGRGIVRSANNFGQLGDNPTHPELLDWLASELIRRDWNLKSIHRLIVTSQAYQMSSKSRPDGLANDPDNHAFWQFPMRRLSAEELRDSVLAVSGDLNLEKFGPSFFPDVADEVKAGQSRPGKGWGNSSVEEQSRRSVYIHIKRSLIPPELSVFDFPETDQTCEARFLTTQAAQALGLLNGKFLQEQADRFANRVEQESADGIAARIALAIRLAYGRTAEEEEVQSAIELTKKLEVDYDLNEHEQLKQYCLVLLNSNEFLYLD
jgi:mono/diheme cytochrome c family protein